MRWNKGRNLTGLHTRELLQERAVRPTWSAVDAALPDRGLDLGSGGGIPAYLLSCLNPALHWTLVERSNKKGLFLEQTAGLMGWPLEWRSQSWQDALSDLESFPLITCRALALDGGFFRWAKEKGLSPQGKLWIWSAGDRRDEYMEKGTASLGPVTRTLSFPDCGDLSFLEFTKTS